MKPIFLRLLLAFSLAAPAAAADRSVSEFSGELKPAAQPVKLDLQIAPLTAAADLKVQQIPAGAQALSGVELPALEPVPGPVQTPKMDGADTAGPLLGWRSPEASADFTQPAQAPSLDKEVSSGREQFDRQASRWSLPAAVPSVRRWLSDLWKGADRVPAWPGKAGDEVKLDGKSYVLESRLGEGNSAIVWRARRGSVDAAVKFIHPEFKNIPQYGQEVLDLEAISRTDIPHAKLLAKSADGLVLVKDYIEGDKASTLLQRPLLETQRAGFAELAARLIRIGYAADIHPNNLVWERWRTRYTLVDAGGFRLGSAWEVLSQILEGAPVKSGRLGAVEFLSGLRGRLGPESRAWARVLEEGKAHPALSRALLELSGRDRSLKPAPHPRFGPAKEEPVLTNEMVTAREVRKRLGYDPLSISPRRMLHGDDPGKLNTQVFSVEAPGHAPVVVKIADRHIVRNELAMRRIVRRFFGGLFGAPGALAVDAGRDSYLVMSQAKGSKTYASDPMDLEHRAAMAVLAVTFGLYDVNRGNVFTASRSETTLIDFEQAFGRRAPTTSRLPDERIAEEMPWMSIHETNRIEDYFPAIRDWTALFLKPETQDELAKILRESGFSDDEIPRYLAQFRANAADLPWTLQNDVEFANLFVERRSSKVNP